MSDSESVKKILRSVLQSSKDGVSVTTLQSEYRSLCGEGIPLRKLGFSGLEEFLRSVPSVVRLDRRTGELRCFAVVCRETSHIAELVARQKSSKKSGRSQMVNCRMRFKPSNPYMLNMRPRSSLRQPSAGGAPKWTAGYSRPHGGHRGSGVSGDYRKLDQRLSSVTPVEHRQPAAKAPAMPDRRANRSANWQKPGGVLDHFEKPPAQSSRPSQSQSGLYDVELEQSRITRLLAKFCSGLWMSKVSELYNGMFSQRLHPQVLKDLETWTHICMVEQSSCNSRMDRLIYPPLPPKPSGVPKSGISNSLPTSHTRKTEVSPHPLTAPISAPPVYPKNRSAKPALVFPKQTVAAPSCQLFSSVSLRSPLHNPALAPQLSTRANLAFQTGKVHQNVSTATTQNKNTLPLAPTLPCPPLANTTPAAASLQPCPDVLPLLKATFSSTSESAPGPKSSADTVSAEVRERTKELLAKYSQGLWAQALPKLFLETYKTPFPEHVLDNLSLLMDMCSVEHPVTNDRKKAILFYSINTDMEAADSQENQQDRSHPLPSGLEVLSSVSPPSLVLPSEQYPSVLVTDAKNSSAVTIRYVGESYSTAQEAMEDAMRSFYSQGTAHHPLANPGIGHLVAVRAEDGEEMARAQVMEAVAPNKFKVYYVDYGFSVETSGSNLRELHLDFLSLPFQATNVSLAGLETFSSHPLVLSSLDTLAVGKILLMETLEPCEETELPVAVLYDTSQDDDLNINAACLKALQDCSMNNPLAVNVTYRDVCVTSVRADGIIYCRLPSRGAARLGKLLDKIEAFFISQMTSKSLVSRPFSGKFCLARYKGKWSRAEISDMYSNSVMEILFTDLGIPATVQVTDLREIPPLLLKDFTIIPPQAIKCRLADLGVPEGDWKPEAVLCMEAFLGTENCKIKIVKLDVHKGNQLVYMYLFVGTDSQEPEKSVNHQLAQSEWWQKQAALNNTASTSSMDTGLSTLMEKLTLSGSVPKPVAKAATQPVPETTTKAEMQPLPLPPPLELPQHGQNMDVYVPVACHPGHFVLQPWQDLHKLTVLLGEMILYYNKTFKSNTTTHIRKGDVYAARIDKNWHRVQVKGILANGFVSVYELDHGKHELVRNNLIVPLIEEFRQLPFQAITAQLAGLAQRQWSEEASMLFRNHVERRALVAQVESVQGTGDKGELWERRLTVYLVDTSVEESELWIHSLMSDIGGELFSAA